MLTWFSWTDYVGSSLTIMFGGFFMQLTKHLVLHCGKTTIGSSQDLSLGTQKTFCFELFTSKMRKLTHKMNCNVKLKMTQRVRKLDSLVKIQSNRWICSLKYMNETSHLKLTPWTEIRFYTNLSIFYIRYIVYTIFYFLLTWRTWHFQQWCA